MAGPSGPLWDRPPSQFTLAHHELASRRTSLNPEGCALRNAAIHFAFSPPDSLRASVGGLRCASPGLLIARDHQRRNALDRVRADAELLGDLVN
jgi:hypothetical protein